MAFTAAAEQDEAFAVGCFAPVVLDRAPEQPRVRPGDLERIEYVSCRHLNSGQLAMFAILKAGGVSA
ncbi:hypothetical protein MWU52_05365 [Jannaschia sp. S6380]|uniref:hypothetical protein n=1 Tax=Jannaschia sp. S6380 TaxID=2926408 RepID=UPI001FF6420D|nr:hypothetical protein [Jannaschia sp. S6380]MCK0166975.1 hypothetical protein [Jannaschia sp. S6380]